MSFEIGDRVFSKNFGTGTVVSCKAYDVLYPTYPVHVRFDNVDELFHFSKEGYLIFNGPNRFTDIKKMEEKNDSTT